MARSRARSCREGKSHVDIISEPRELRRQADAAWRCGSAIGLVPTMGSLHSGHMALVEGAQKSGCDWIVLSLFVNPLQFGVHEDLSRYPRDLDSDLRRCREAGVDVVFVPAVGSMFPSGFQTYVEVSELAESLEGRCRPGHFRGVATVVAKLLQLTAPCTAIFGRKDYQQWKIIERMVADLEIPAKIVGQTIVRDADGVALSSRNQYLSGVDRQRARSLVNALCAAADAWESGERSAANLQRLTEAVLLPQVDGVDYVAVVDPQTLQSVEGECASQALLCLAARLGATRLIDNIVLGEESPPLRFQKRSQTNL